MKVPLIQENIKLYLNKKATKTILSRGRSLYNNHSVFLEHFENDKWEFKVKGSLIYRVVIQGVVDGNIISTCNCPYDWGGICKHTVASLLYIQDNFDISGISSNIMTNRKKQPKRVGKEKRLEITNYKFLEENDIIGSMNRNNARRLTTTNYHYNTDVLNTLCSNSVLKFRVAYQWDVYDVKIQKIEGKVYISTTEKLKNQYLSESEAVCLLFIANSPTPDLIEIMLFYDRAEGEQELLQEYGLTGDFNDYFEYYFNPEVGVGVVRAPNALDLIPISGEFENKTLDYIKAMQKEQFAFSPAQKKEERMLAFLLRPDVDEEFIGNDFNDDYDFVPDYESIKKYDIIAIIGKPNAAKNKLNSFIDIYRTAYYNNIEIEKSENADKIIELLQLVNTKKSDYENFSINKKIFDLLTDEKLVYTYKDIGGTFMKSNLMPIQLSKEPINIYFSVIEDDKFVNLIMKYKMGNDLIDNERIDFELSNNQIVVVDDKYCAVATFEASSYLESNEKTYKMVKTHKDVFYEKVIAPLSNIFEISFGEGIYDVKSYELDFNAKQVFLSEEKSHIIISPQVEYTHGVSTLLSSKGNILLGNGDKITEYKRNFDLEDDFLDTIACLHPKFDSEQRQNRIFYLHIDEFTKDLWFYKFFDKMQANNVEVFGLKDLKSFKYSPYKGQVNTSVTSGIDWFEVKIELTFGNTNIKLNDIRKAILNKQKYIQLKDGSVGILPTEWIDKLEKYFRNGEIRKNKLNISQLRFSIIDELFDNLDDNKVLKNLSEKRRRLAQFTEISNTKVPDTVKASLRDYQKEGLNWLNFLHDMKWGGILADDMGLGKTLQVLTFLQHINSKKKSTSLIVVPTTLLFNWEKEIEKFTPSLKALYHYGATRAENTDTFHKYHIVFTSYGVLLRDIEMLKDFAFNYAILDESQAIKNPASRRYKAANIINAKNRIAMTGTPIENSTFDLFAQMSFVNPGFFGGANNFKENYSTPIDKDGDETIATELQKLINPFVLRRTKEKVAQELPSKTEDVIYCEMDTAQREIYDSYRNTYRQKLMENIENEGLGKSKIMVLEGLMRLRQICDSPVLLKDESINIKQSVKIQEIIKHITQKTANHKILIFSQFVEMLSLLREELDKLNIRYEYLDGKSSTTQREASVDNFQNNSKLRTFLISLKAGGTGLNLTAADYVYILDPWWNPAVENQAIDRCYRIGQDKKVFAYRMICRNTIEEKIVELQNKKKKIASDIVQTDESIMKKIDANDIKELFS